MRIRKIGICLLALLLLTLLGSSVFAKPNLFDPVEETGVLVFRSNKFYVNGMELKLGSERIRASDYDENGTVDMVWQELLNLRGRKVTIAGYRDRLSNNYDRMYVMMINGRYFPNPKVR
jgi:hypothetical protein